MTEKANKISVKDQFRKAIEEKKGVATIKLPASKVEVTYPKALMHKDIMRATRLAKGELAKMQAICIVQNCTFNGEKITLSDFTELLLVEDSALLLSKIFGDDEDEDDLGEDQDLLN